MNHYDYPDSAFLAALEDCSFPPELFSHEAHLRLAWLNLNLHGLDGGIVATCQHITRYVAHLGAQDKYDHGLTVNAVRTVFHCMQQAEAANFTALLANCPALKTDFASLMAEVITQPYPS